MKTILITGGAGFIGSNLCHRLLNDSKENQIICLDNLYTGCIKNISDILYHPRFLFMNDDIVKLIDFKEHIDEIYNLASPASPIKYQSNPIYTTKTNVIGVLNLLEIAYKYNSKFLQASTSEIYGDPLITPQTENYFGNVKCTGIRSCYDEGKRCAESLIFDFYRMHDLNIKVVRIFNTYGPYMAYDDGRVISNFIVQALKGENITVYGDGNQTRSFCYIDDLIDGILKMMYSDDNITGPFNIGNPDERSIIEIAKIINSICGNKSKIIYKSLPQDDPKQRCPDITKANHFLDWSPSISLEDGLSRTINYFRDVYMK